MRHFRLQLAVTVLVTLAAACGGGGESTGPKPGTSVGIQFVSPDASPGDTVIAVITFGRADSPGDPLELVLNFDGGPNSVDTTRIPAGNASLAVGLIVPADLPDGTINVKALLPTERDSASAQLTVRAAFRPVLNPYEDLIGVGPGPHLFSGQRGEVSLVAGTQVQLTISATDSINLTYVGYSFGPPANVSDSIAVSSQGGNWAPVVAIPANWGGTAPELIEFARNSVGQRAQVSWGAIGIGQYLNRPVVSAPLDTSFRDIAYDGKRNVLYLAIGDQSSITVVSVPGLTPLPTIPLPGPAQSLDLTPGGDTLVVALQGTGNLALVNLAASGQPTSVVPVKTLTGNLATALRIRVAANDRAIVEGTDGLIAHFNLVTGTDSLDVQSTGADSTMARSADANRIVLTNVGYGSGFQTATIYDASSNTYAATGDARIDYGTAQPTVDQHGTHFLVQEFLFDYLGGEVGWLAYNPSGPRTSALSPEGANAFLSLCGSAGCASGPGYYARFGIPGPQDTIQFAQIAQLLEVVNTPAYLQMLLPLTDGKTLIAIGGGNLLAFDLTQSSPASFAKIAHGSPHGAVGSSDARSTDGTQRSPRHPPIPQMFVHVHTPGALAR